jgi:hypothetical protein
MLNKMIIIIDKETDLAYLFKEKSLAGEFLGVSRNTIHNHQKDKRWDKGKYAVYYPQNKIKKSNRGGKKKKLCIKPS